MITPESIALELGGRRIGKTWMAKCPAHDDRNPSLSVCEEDGRILVHCHAGCEQRDVIRALDARGLWRSPLSFAERIECAYDYTDESGRVLYQVVRLHSPKSFKHRYPDPACRDGWRWKKHPRQVLYRLHELTSARIIFVVEGEKDVESLRSYGFIATTNAGGADAPWLDAFTDTLRGKEIVLIPDNDAPGWEHAIKIGKALFGKVARIIVLHDIHRDAKDISDWFSRGHRECELISMLDGANAH